jgi:hypothetical protein
VPEQASRAGDPAETIPRFAARALAAEILLAEPGSLGDDALEQSLRRLRERLLARATPVPKSNDYAEAVFEMLLDWLVIELDTMKQAAQQMTTETAPTWLTGETDRITETVNRITAKIFPR